MAKAKRITIAPNIYEYPDGQREAQVRVAGLKPRLHRFAAGTDVAKIDAWIVTTRDEMRDELKAFGTMAPQDRRRAVGTLEGDAPDFFAQIAGRGCFKSDRSHTRAWFPIIVDGVRLGALARTAITKGHINKAIAQMQARPSPRAIRKVRVGGYARGDETIGGYVRAAPATSGAVVADLTIRHRLRMLQELYRTLDGEDVPTPVDYANWPKRKKTLPITLPAATVEAVLLKLLTIDAKTFGRFAVVTTTAQRPCQVGRALPEDVNLTTGIWIVRNAKNEPAHSITLNATHIDAWEAFARADAWGEFDTGKYGKLIHAAGWPVGIRPYAARHSLAREAIRLGINLGDLQGLLGHVDPKTTRIYAPFVIERQRQVSDGMTDYLANVFKLRKVKG